MGQPFHLFNSDNQTDCKRFLFVSCTIFVFSVPQQTACEKKNASTSKDELKYWTNTLKHQMCSNILFYSVLI